MPQQVALLMLCRELPLLGVCGVERGESVSRHRPCCDLATILRDPQKRHRTQATYEGSGHTMQWLYKTTSLRIPLLYDKGRACGRLPLPSSMPWAFSLPSVQKKVMSKIMRAGDDNQPRVPGGALTVSFLELGLCRGRRWAPHGASSRPSAVTEQKLRWGAVGCQETVV